MPRGEFKHRYWFFADAPNIGGNFSLFEKIYDGKPILTSSQTSRRMYNTVVPLILFSFAQLAKRKV
jgi:hypothetical protein